MALVAPPPVPDAEAPALPASGPPGWRPWPVLLTVCLGYFLASWAMAPVAGILPTIARDLDLPVQAAGWVMSAYFVTLVGTVLVMGRLGDLLGHARVFGLGGLAFTLGQLLCGLSAGLPSLLAGRALQGLGSAMIMGTSLAIIALAIPARLRGRAIGMLTMAAAAASVVGVWLSTWSVEHLSWQWAFFLPLPIGIASAAFGFRMRLPTVRVASHEIDWLGGVLLFATIAAAMLSLSHLHEGPDTFQAGAPYHLEMNVLTGVLFVAFVKVEQRARAPLVGFRLLRQTEFATGITANGLAHMGMLATTFLLPFLLERGRGLGPAETGLLLMMQQLSTVTFSLLLGFLYDRARSPLFSIGLMAVIAGGLSTYGLIGGSLPFAGLLTVAVILGGSLGGFTTVNNTALMALAPSDQRGFAAGLIETTRQLGHTVGVSVSSSFMGAAVAGVAVPGVAEYVAGFQGAGLAMGSLSALGLLVLAWPRVRSAARAGGRLAHPRPIAGGSE